ncbi:uncharacterized protein LOC132199927 [Neocloeon triangulifer]|uniref:uncharacterized protein LOC132199927 n=1 Tax=Neocloeon triangulifer TaxID=2078957 RepID=UPI00286F5142|nr:uncharacterized protein LOC132199927 [Neocloeon triangulifer]
MLARIFFVLAIVQFSNVIEALEKRLSDSVVLGTSCKIRSKALPDEYLTQLPKDQAGLVASAPLNGSPLNAKWRIDQLTVDSYNYFEIYNRQFETYLTNYYYSEMWMATGAKQNFASSNKWDTLWIVEPAQLNVPVTIKHAVTGSYLTVPKGNFAQRHVILSSRLSSGSESKWEIIC